MASGKAGKCLEEGVSDCDAIGNAKENVKAARSHVSGGDKSSQHWRRNPIWQQRKRMIEDWAVLWYKQYVLRRLFRLRIISPTEGGVGGREIDLDVKNNTRLIDGRTGTEYIGNTIRTSRYTLWNFIPCQLWFQFSKIANFYFLVVGILQLIPGLSTTGTYTTILPLLFFLCFSVGREGYDDFRRYRLDRVENRRVTRVLYGFKPGGVKGNPRISWLEKTQRLWTNLKADVNKRGEKSLFDAVLSSPQFNSTSNFEGERTMTSEAPSPWTSVKWMYLKVGDVIELARDERVPADIALLHANGRDGIAYIETMELDGETNLKRKRPVRQLAAHCGTLPGLVACRAQFAIENPNADLYSFDGNLSIDNEMFPITLGNVVCRGSTLRNTPRAIGLVINTGEECKIRMNASQNARVKAPAVQAITNKIVILLTVFLLLLSAGCTAGYEIWARVFEDKAWYLKNSRLPLEDISIAFIIEFNNLIPLALYVSMEIIKFAQFLLLQDIECYDEESNTPMVCNTQTIFENLGQVNHIFTDKTGTLTENVMHFRKMSVAGIVWQHHVHGRGRVGIEVANVEQQVQSSEGPPQNTGLNEIASSSTKNVPVVTVSPVDESNATQSSQEPASNRRRVENESHSRLLDYLRDYPSTSLAQKIRFFLLSLALCHTCFPEAQDKGGITFQAESPDELALVEAARELGYSVIDRDARSVRLLIHRPDSEAAIQETYEVLDIIEFSSMRKRMSIIVRFPDGRICIFCKGADSVIQQRLRLSSLAHEKATEVLRMHREHAGEEAREVLLRKSQDTSARSSFNSPRLSMDKSTAGRGLAWSARGSASLEIRSFELGSRLSGRYSTTFETDPRALQLGIKSSRKSFDRRTAKRSGDTFGMFDDLDDGTIFQRCFQQIDDFATEGLRTLLYGYRFIDEDEYASWQEIHHRATTSLANRQQMIESAGEIIERDFELAGATAIEDKLQKGIPETIEKLRRANIKIWMLSGDKRETAVNIAHSSQICKSYSRVIILDQNSGIQDQIDSALLELAIGNIAHSVVVIDGRTLEAVESEGLTTLLYDLLLHVDSVICCRATPSQKAAMVKAIRQKIPESMTLAIGDGGNDIAMIQEAHVGVGISGKEGLQAARVADYSIAQFRFLQRLLFVHGHWNYVRTAKYILFTFWKEMMFYSIQVLYQRWNGYTGTSLFESDSLAVWNTLFTSLPVMLPGIFEQDLKAATLLAVPELYAYGQESRGLNMVIYGLWMVLAVVEALIIYFMIYALYGVTPVTEDQGLFAIGNLAFSVCVVFINVKLLVLQYHYKTWVPIFGAALTISGWWAWCLLLSAIYTNSAGEYTVYRGFTEHFGKNPTWWAVLVAVLAVVIMLELGIDMLQKIYWPSSIDVWQELEQDSEIRKRLEMSGGEGGYGLGIADVESANET
ncbi:phospholipid-transporting ATPase [Hyphodiscus hymeniophilus]|uniref:Phospholipid-transporting ATPase n=1 Tax=Hyphodiscus hymeniophilus TaxID=353542 RepID=A0A9P6VG92_9HELO|nr:phospholipid-transporting ATPase [Hyphodiscus hymeniophilus]